VIDELPVTAMAKGFDDGKIVRATSGAALSFGERTTTQQGCATTSRIEYDAIGTL
jgi:hypothetical protein